MKKNINKLLTKLACTYKNPNRDVILLVDNLFNPDAELVDNYALFEYLQTKEEYKNKSFYIINKKNVQYKEIKAKYKNIIPVKNTKMNLKLALMLFKTKYWLDSFQVINFFNVNLPKYFKKNDIIPVYMQHGINFFKYGFLEAAHSYQIGEQVFKKIVFSSEAERNLFKKYYRYDDRNTILAGLSRWDNIKNSTEKTIFVYLTHRTYLRHHSLDFTMTNYYKNLVALLNSERLKRILEETNTNLKLAVHHETKRFMNFSLPNIELIEDKDIGKIKNSASMLITDFSSMCFDFMFKDKPVIFFRLDKDDPLFAIDKEGKINNDNVESKNEELYNICYDAEAVINIIEKYCHNNFELEDEYKEKNNKFFAYRENIREKIIDGILSSPLDIENKATKIPSEKVLFNQTYNFSGNVPFALDGISGKDLKGRWSLGDETIFWFEMESKKACTVKINVDPFVNKKHKKQKIDVFLNGKLMKTYEYKYQKDIEPMIINLELSDLVDGIQELTFKYKDAKSPKKLRLSNDNRKLAVFFKDIIVEEK